MFQLKRLKLKQIKLIESSTRRNCQTVFSGIQPTGTIHIGNYFGAINEWKKLLSNANNKCIFSIVNLHSLTAIKDGNLLRSNTRLIAGTLIASGLEPSKCILFKQSDVLYHTQFSWILCCLTSLPKLYNFPKYKEYLEMPNKKNFINVGIFLYPILQSADILMYKTNLVPGGKDQLQSIHYAQHLCGKFNRMYKDIFPFPNFHLAEKGFAIKSLRNPERKMSKSDDPKSFISLLDPPEVIRSKCKKAMTDFTPEVYYDPDVRPGVSNLMDIHSLCTDSPVEMIEKEAKGLTTSEYKMLVADVINETFTPIREKILEITKDEHYLNSVLKSGAERASEIAEKTLSEVNSLLGFKLDEIKDGRMDKVRL